jgi:alkylhydroperoxidase family enzyme
MGDPIRPLAVVLMAGLAAGVPAFAQAPGNAGAPLPEAQQVSRLPVLPQPLDPALAQMFERRRALGGSVINLTLTEGHAPKLARAAEAMAFSLRLESQTPRGLRELAILRTAQIVGADYEIHQHLPMMRMCGYSEPQIAQVATWSSSELFDDRERALLAYVEQMAHGGDVDDATFDALARYFSPREIVEISVTVGNYYGTGLLTKALKIRIETDGRLTVPGRC